MKNDQIVPYSGFVVVEAIKEEKTASGFLKTDEASKQTQKGLVISVGDPILEHQEGSVVQTECPAKVGDTVIFKKYSNQTVSVGGKDYELVEFGHLMGGVK